MPGVDAHQRGARALRLDWLAGHRDVPAFLAVDVDDLDADGHRWRVVGPGGAVRGPGLVPGHLGDKGRVVTAVVGVASALRLRAPPGLRFLLAVGDPH